MKVSGRRQILGACLGLVVGSSLAFAYFLGWQLGVPVAFLGSGSALLFYGVITHKKDRSPD